MQHTGWPRWLLCRWSKQVRRAGSKLCQGHPCWEACLGQDIFCDHLPACLSNAQQLCPCTVHLSAPLFNLTGTPVTVFLVGLAIGTEQYTLPLFLTLSTVSAAA